MKFFSLPVVHFNVLLINSLQVVYGTGVSKYNQYLICELMHFPDPFKYLYSFPKYFYWHFNTNTSLLDHPSFSWEREKIEGVGPLLLVAEGVVWCRVQEC